MSIYTDDALYDEAFGPNVDTDCGWNSAWDFLPTSAECDTLCSGCGGGFADPSEEFIVPGDGTYHLDCYVAVTELL